MTAGRSMIRRIVRRRNYPIRCSSKYSRVTASVVVIQLLFFLLSYPSTFYSTATYAPIVMTDLYHDEKVSPRLLLNEEQSNGRGAGNDKEKQHDDANHNNEDQHHSSATYNTQRHPNNYYYTNGNRISTNSASKSAYSYYDYNDDDSYFSSNSRNRKKNGGSNQPMYNYTTKLSDVYWCLLIALGWTIWMIHSIATLRQQQYNSMLQQKYNTSNADGIFIDENGASIHDAALIKSSPLDDNDTNKIRIFQAQYSSLLLLRGHVLDVLHDPAVSAAAAETPIVGIVPTCTVIVDYVVERQQQPLKSPVSSTAPLNHDRVATLPTMNDDSNPSATTTEFIQIRKHFETSFTDIEVGFGNVEILVLPNDPMCSMLKYDYDMYIEQEQRIQRVIAQEQLVRSQRRKKHRQRRKMKDLKRPTLQYPSSDEPIRNRQSDEMIHPPDPNNVSTSPMRQNLKIIQVETQNDVDDDLILYATGNSDDEDDIFGCDMCYTCCDCTYDQYQWKRLSLFFAAVLVIASILGTVHVVSRMDPKKKYLGWISLSIGLLLLIPVAMYIHKVIILCHRWSDAQPPEKQGYIVQSSTMTGTITSYNNGDENNDNRYGIKPLKSPLKNASAISLSDACLRPSCTDMMDDLCDPSCSNHTFNTTTGINLHKATSCGRNAQMGFSYVVPAMSGCYFINYPTKDPNHRHGHDSACKFKQSDLSRPHTSQHNVANSDVQPPMNISSSSNHHQRSNNETSSIVSTSSMSSISSNDDPKMQQLSIWNTILHKVHKVGTSNDNEDSV